MLKFGDVACLPGGLLFTRKPDLESLEEPASQLVMIQRNVNFWLGDFLNHGLSQFGDDFWQVFPENCSLKMLNRCAAMSREFPMTERATDLSWTHHAHLRPYSKEVRRAMLHKAVENRWDSEQLLEHLKRMGA